MKKSSLIALVGVVVTVVSLFLPWYEILGETLAPISTSTGIIILVLAVIAGYLAYANNKMHSKGKAVGVLVLGVLAAIVVLMNGGTVNGVDFSEYTKFGYYLSMIGAVVVAVGGVLGLACGDKK